MRTEVIVKEKLAEGKWEKPYASEKLHISSSGLEGAACEKLRKYYEYSSNLGGLSIGIRF